MALLTRPPGLFAITWSGVMARTLTMTVLALIAGAAIAAGQWAGCHPGEPSSTDFVRICTLTPICAVGELGQERLRVSLRSPFSGQVIQGLDIRLDPASVGFLRGDRPMLQSAQVPEPTADIGEFYRQPFLDCPTQICDWRITAPHRKKSCPSTPVPLYDKASGARRVKVDATLSS